jgi:hypothetical protein
MVPILLIATGCKIQYLVRVATMYMHLDGQNNYMQTFLPNLHFVYGPDSMVHPIMLDNIETLNRCKSKLSAFSRIEYLA